MSYRYRQDLDRLIKRGAIDTGAEILPTEFTHCGGTHELRYSNECLNNLGYINFNTWAICPICKSEVPFVSTFVELN